MAGAVERLGSIDPAAAARASPSATTSSVTAAGYEHVYRQAIAADRRKNLRRSAQGVPKSSGARLANQLMSFGPTNHRATAHAGHPGPGTGGERGARCALALLERDDSGAVTLAALRECGESKPLPKPYTTSSSPGTQSTASQTPTPQDTRVPDTASAAPQHPHPHHPASARDAVRDRAHAIRTACRAPLPTWQAHEPARRPPIPSALTRWDPFGELERTPQSL